MTKPTLLLTRPLAQSRAFLADLTHALGHDPNCIISPTTRITQMLLEKAPANAQAIVFTSVNGVEFYAAQSSDRAAPAFCVGPSTYAAAIKHGFTAQNANGDGHDLLDLVLSKTKPANGPILYISGNHAAVDLAQALRTHGYTACRQIVYSQTAEPLSRAALTILTRDPVIIPLFSPRSAANFLAALPTSVSVNASFLCISENAAIPLRQTDYRIKIASEPNRKAMITALTNLI